MSDSSETVGAMFDLDSEEPSSEQLGRGVNLSLNPFGIRRNIIRKEHREIIKCVNDACEGHLSLPNYVGGLKDLVEAGYRTNHVNPAGVIVNVLPYSREIRGGLTPSKPIY